MTATAPAPAALRADGLVRHYPVRSGGLRRSREVVHAVDGVDLVVEPGRTLGIVGESGCGKSTLARMLALLDRPTSGELQVDGQPTTGLGERALRGLRRNVQMVFQDPYTSLNPRQTVGDIVREPFEVHRDVVPRDERDDRVAELLETVGLKADFVDRYPHQFSGGQRQRIGIARALALGPRVLVCDEAVSALDVSVQAQVINLLMDLKERTSIAIVFVSHDLGVVRQICDSVSVMYLGRICESGPAATVLDNPQHPYTAALLSASPAPEDTSPRQRIILQGEPPTPLHPPAGCRFHPRCWKAQPICAEQTPPLALQPAGTVASCHFPGPPYFKG